jgi:predicted N-acetyltransferase YhbS
MSNIRYEINQPLSAAEFIGVLQASGLSERRPVEDLACVEGMVGNSNLTVCAKEGDRLIGVARSVTDFSYCCYLSDLAVDRDYQKLGIGRDLIRISREQLGPLCKLILLSAPDAAAFYPKIGFSRHDQAWLIDGDKPLK